MKFEEYLLTCLIEECAEVIQRATKAQRFGLKECQPEQSLDNSARLRHELIDLKATIDLCQSFELIDAPRDELLEKLKILKLRKFADYSASLGTLELPDDTPINEISFVTLWSKP